MKQLSFPRGSTWTKQWALSSTLALALVNMAEAHPGHSLADHGVAHVASSPYHISVLAGVGLVLWMMARFVKSPVTRRWLQAGGIATVAFAAAWWGVGL